MSRLFLSPIRLLTLAAAIVFATSGTALASHGGGGHGGGGGGHGGGFHGGGFHGAAVGGYHGGYGRGYGGYGRGYSGYGWGGGWYGGYGWPGWGGYDYPYAYSYPSYTDDSGGAVYAPSYTDVVPYTDRLPSQTDNRVHLAVMVPDPSAEVQINGVNMSGTGMERDFVSPPIGPGHYTYNVQASWMENGQRVTKDESVDVVAGSQSIVNFSMAH